MKDILDSIIINGVRYDVKNAKSENPCEECDLRDICGVNNNLHLVCDAMTRYYEVFKKSNKQFEL